MARSERERGGAGRGFLVALLLLLVIGLAGTVVYLLSERNHGRYRLAVVEGSLVVERGRRLPAGFERFAPEAEPLQGAYAAIALPAGESLGEQEVFEDRGDLDAALFSLLANWARTRLDSRTQGEFELALGLVRRCELLPGLSEEQRGELRTLRADLAYRSGRRILADVVTQLERALGELRTAKQLGTSRPLDLDRWIAEVERRIADYRQADAGGPGTGPRPQAQSPGLLPEAGPAEAGPEGALLEGEAAMTVPEAELPEAGASPATPPAPALPEAGPAEAPQPAPAAPSMRENGDASTAPWRL